MSKKQLILFDGVCNFCGSAVNFIIKRDPNFTFVFASIQSELGKVMVKKYGLQCKPDTFALVRDGQCYIMSDAALEVATQMSGGWPLLQVFKLVPKRVRDFVYVYFGRNRYRWFGKRDFCAVPTPDIRARFIDDL